MPALTRWSKSPALKATRGNRERRGRSSGLYGEVGVEDRKPLTGWPLGAWRLNARQRLRAGRCSGPSFAKLVWPVQGRWPLAITIQGGTLAKPGCRASGGDVGRPRQMH